MKVGLITYHRSANYGACLQSYATQKVLQDLGYDVTIIDYLNEYEQRNKNFFFSGDGSKISLAKNIIKNIIFKNKYNTEKSFSNFYKYYNLSEDTYRSVEEMKDLIFDTLIVGSDQVWNPEITGKLDYAFLLDFGHANKRISIASSLGSVILSEQQQRKLYSSLKHFSAISVREKFAQKQLNNLGIKNVKVICDPTLMISKKFWESFMITTENNYILSFFVSGSFRKFSNDISKIRNQLKLHYPVYNVQSYNYRWNGVDKIIAGLSPQEFIGNIYNAKAVITDSFHGTLFSIIFHKPLVIINNKKNPIRILELLDMLNLKNQVCYIDNILYIDNYSNVDLRIDEVRWDAINWISNAIK